MICGVPVAPTATTRAPAPGPAGASIRRRLPSPAWSARTLARVARRSPATVTVVALGWLLGLATGFPAAELASPLIDHVATGLGPLAAGRWWTPLTAMLWWGGPVGSVTTAMVLLVAGAVAERRVGAARMLVALVGSQVLGTCLALGLVAGGTALGGAWTTTLAGRITIGAAPAAAGLALAASSALSARWRRRLRLFVIVFAVVLTGYSGTLTSVVLFATALVGLAAGPVVCGRTPRPPLPGRASRSEVRVLLALAVAASAIGPLVASAVGEAWGPLSALRVVVLSPRPDPQVVAQLCAGTGVRQLFDCHVGLAHLRLTGPATALSSVVPALLLLVTAEGLRRGRRAALWFGTLLNLLLASLGTYIAIEVLARPDEHLLLDGLLGSRPGVRPVLGLLVPPLLPFALAGLLLWSRGRFAVRAPAGTYKRLTAVCGVTLLAVSTAFVLVGATQRGGFDRPVTIIELLGELPRRFLPPGYLGVVDPSFLPAQPVTAMLFEGIGALFWLVVAGGLLFAFTRTRLEAAGTDARRARELLVTHGGGDLSWITTWEGNRYWFAPSGRSAVAYRVAGSVAVTTADPLGPAQDRAETLAGFTAFCREEGVVPALYSVTAATRDAAAAVGWRGVQIAEETVLTLPGLEFTGRRWQDVRTALNAASRSGTTAVWLRWATASIAVRDQIRTISEEWVADKGLPEMGFTLGGLDELADPQVRCLVAVDADDTVQAVTSWMPVYRDGRVVGWTLDFMRRRTVTRDGEAGLRGVVEFLIATAAHDLRDEGYAFVSLSGAPLAQVDRPGDEPSSRLDRVLDQVGAALEPMYGFRSLLAFKAKFQPSYEPLYLVYPDPVVLPAIGLAIGRCYLPDLTARQYARLLRRLT